MLFITYRILAGVSTCIHATMGRGNVQPRKEDDFFMVCLTFALGSFFFFFIEKVEKY